MIRATLKDQIETALATEGSNFVHTVSIAEKSMLLLGGFSKDEQSTLFQLGYHIYPVLFADKSLTPENLRCLPLKDISCIIIKKDSSKAYLKGLAVIKQLKLHENFPVLLYDKNMEGSQELGKLSVVDEVIDSLADGDSINFKITFLTKYKKLTLVRFTIPDKLNAVKRAWSYSVRRLFDIVVSLALLLLLLPVMLIIALLLKLESRGPVFYISKRAGKHYKIFSCIKYRTMIVDADTKLKDLQHLNQYSVSIKSPQFIKIKDDPRVTRFGSFLRNSSLDELPQLINVLIGDMSLVGNRPLPLYEAATLTNDVYSNRFNAPAGITGLWQVLKRGEEDMSTEERIELDIKYAQSNSLFVDIWILLKTPFAMFQKSNV